MTPGFPVWRLAEPQRCKCGTAKTLLKKQIIVAKGMALMSAPMSYAGYHFRREILAAEVTQQLSGRVIIVIPLSMPQATLYSAPLLGLVRSLYRVACTYLEIGRFVYVCVGVIHPSGRPGCVPPSFATAQLFKCGRDLSRVVAVGEWHVERRRKVARLAIFWVVWLRL